MALWDGRTGRHVALDPASVTMLEAWLPGSEPGPRLAALAGRMRRARLLQEDPAPDARRLIPAKSRLVLALPDVPALWLPAPFERTAGGHTWREWALTGEQLALWRAFNGARTLEAAVEVAGAGIAAAMELVARACAAETQALQLRDAPTAPRDPSLGRVVAPARPRGERTAMQYSEGATALEEWHRGIASGGTSHFDDRETTVAHSFGVPHPALGGSTYGERLHEALAARGWLETGPTLEIGPGDGEMGAAWLGRAAETGQPPGEYLRLDVAPALLQEQRRRMPGTREVTGAATAIGLADASVGLVLCNEVMADLPSGPEVPGGALVNVGARLLIREVARVLAPGGHAFLSEFGTRDEEPEEAVQLDHPEVSIRFDDLVGVAGAVGLRADVVPLAELLGMDLGAPWLARSSYEGLRARLHADGRTLAARAWTAETLSLPWNVEGLQWVPVTEEGPGPVVTRFLALLLSKP